MKVGLFVTNQHGVDRDMVAALDEQIAMVHAVRDAGWDSLFTGQHYLNEGDNKQLQIVPFLARLVPEAGDMTVGLGVLLLSLHNPVYVAETVASLDVIARGRLVFGIGLGYREVEYDAFRVPRGQRVARFEECLELVLQLWSGRPVTHDSDVCRLDGVQMTITPVQRPHPPIWIAANSDAAVRRAARLGDAWFINPHATLATVRRQHEVYLKERRSHGRPPPTEVPLFKEIYCAEDRATALELAGPYLAGKYRNYAQWGQDAALPAGESFDKEIDELVVDRFVLGSPDECLEQLEPYRREMGVNHLVLRTHWAGMPLDTAMRSIDLLSEHVVPELHRM